ncbi:hypothetical protein HAX54_002364 [Datura stramonium]|uniref:Uncharacterized protein n=1 Tax=Datura stramonium TaxID=4076 RepID=A0ABS8T3S9_DATST|nr:hypothetical protein [Datura stramonium]
MEYSITSRVLAYSSAPVDAQTEEFLLIQMCQRLTTMSEGFSLVLVQHKERDFLVAFGGFKKDPSNEVEAFIMEKNELSMGRRSLLSKAAGNLLSGNRLTSTGPASQPINGTTTSHVDSIARQNLASVVEHHGSGRKSLSESLLIDPSSVPGNVSLRKQFSNDEDAGAKMTKSSGDESPSQEQGAKQLDIGIKTSSSGGKIMAEEMSTISDLTFALLITDKQVPTFFKTLMILSSKKVIIKLDYQLLQEMELLKEKLASVELAQEEANSLSNIVHLINVRLEHDVAFLKAVMDDTQKELHTTRGVLAGERARAFQLQFVSGGDGDASSKWNRMVEVFHLKQRLQSLENRSPTPGNLPRLEYIA